MERDIAKSVATQLIGVYSTEEQGKKIRTIKYQSVTSVKIDNVYRVILKKDTRTHIATLSIYKAKMKFQHPEYDKLFRRSHKVKRYKLKGLSLLQKNKESKELELIRKFEDTLSIIEYIIAEIKGL